MSASCLLSTQNLDPGLGLGPEPKEFDDQDREILDLIRGKAASARDFYRRTHAIVQEAQRLIEQASARAKDAERRAKKSEAALKGAEARASRAEAQIVQLTAHLATLERHHPAPASNDLSQISTTLRRVRPTLPIRATAKPQARSGSLKIWPFR
jgi:chromosome segregation ATPase